MADKCGYCLDDRALVEGRDPFFLQSCLYLRPPFGALYLFLYLREENDESKSEILKVCAFEERLAIKRSS